MRPNSSWQEKTPGAYDINQFKINWKTKTVTCPQGKKAGVGHQQRIQQENQSFTLNFQRRIVVNVLSDRFVLDVKVRLVI